MVPTQQNILKRPSNSRQSAQKYARIIINQNMEGEEIKKIPKKEELVTISPKKIDTCSSLEFIDLETELKTNTVPKPMHTMVVNAQSIKNKPDIKHFVGRGIMKLGGTSKITPEDVYVVNRAVRRRVQSPEYVRYRVEDMEDDFEEGDIEKWYAWWVLYCPFLFDVSSIENFHSNIFGIMKIVF